MGAPSVNNVTFPQMRTDLNAAFLSLFAQMQTVMSETAAVAYVSASSFTVAGNKTSIYVANRALALTQSSSGVTYVSTSSYSAGTGLTTVNTANGQAVDNGLSAVAYGPLPSALPHTGLPALVANTFLFANGAGTAYETKTVAATNSLLKSSSNITVTVGTGGDYAEIADAVYDVYNKYSIAAKELGVTVTINCLSGYQMQKSVLLKNVDCGWMTISSVDAEVTIVRSAINAQPSSGEGGGGYKHAFYGYNSRMPVINTLFNTDTSGSASSLYIYYITKNSSGIILSGKGFKGAGGTNCAVIGNSRLHAVGGDFRSAVYDGLSLNDSMVVANSCNCSSCGRYGIAAYGSYITAHSATITGCAYNIWACNGSVITANSATLTGATTNGVAVVDGTWADFRSADARRGGSDAATDFVVGTGSWINATGGTGGVSKTANTLTSDGVICK